MSYVIGLTGGIGSGKTLVSDHFAKLGIAIIDTDIIARQIVEPGHPVLAYLSEEFGDHILNDDGSLNRQALRTIAFSNDESKAKLDAITHPAIRIETIKQIEQASTPYCIVVVPLLRPNSPFIELMQRILVVTANRETKIERVKKRSNLSREEVSRIMDTQLNDSKRLNFANDVINNNGSTKQAYAEVEKLHNRYLDLARQC